MAVAGTAVMAGLGLSVPGDVSVVSREDSALRRPVRPGLTASPAIRSGRRDRRAGAGHAARRRRRDRTAAAPGAGRTREPGGGARVRWSGRPRPRASAAGRGRLARRRTALVRLGVR
ncbi:hypothetical protein ACIOEX_10735 [Streptomyces sp. NPDC087850]|uniref:hypothetical protein n=1 Tax=Streptomyces sp. NPDC087850 TaxID=3365809 RepID=UPI0038088EB1